VAILDSGRTFKWEGGNVIQVLGLEFDAEHNGEVRFQISVFLKKLQAFTCSKLEMAKLLGMKMFYCDCFSFLFVGGAGGHTAREGRVCTRCVGLCVSSEKMKIYSYLHVAKNPYPQDDS
jgi:hypothetical protein